MKSKKIFLFLVMLIAFLGIVTLSNKVNAATISDDGKYSLVLTANEFDGCFDGEYSKLVRFNIAEGETTVKLSELTKGIIPFNGKTEFSHWEMAENTKASEELEIAIFTGTGYFYTTTGKEVNYTNGLTLSAKFSDKELKDSGKYYVSFDAFAGTINGKAKLTLESKVAEFKTIDLTKYTPVRKGYTFKGWDLDGKIVTSINSSAFTKDAVITLTATYTKDTFDGTDRVLVLNANGGTISGKTSNKYDYLGGGNSGTAMSLLPYTPVREGYKFTGWNTKEDGSGKNYTYIYWRRWDKDDKDDLNRDTIIKNSLGAEYYQNVTLYASWTKTSEETEQPVKETVKEIQSTGETKAKIEFAKEVSKDYKLDIKPVEVEKDLSSKNVKYVVDINIFDGDTKVSIKDTDMTIRVKLPEDLKGFNKYEVVYIKDGKIEENFDAKIDGDYLVFKTTHLSEYGIIATNTTNTSNSSNNTENISNPKTGDNIVIYVAMACVSIIGMSVLSINIKRK